MPHNSSKLAIDEGENQPSRVPDRDHKKTEVAEEMLRMATDSAELGTWYINCETREFVPSPRLKQIFGYGVDEDMPYEAAITQIAKDYQDIVLNAVEASISKGEKYCLEYPVIGFHDKIVRWVRAIGKLNNDAEGKPAYFTGVLQDISDRKIEEEKIKNDQSSLIEIKEALAASELKYRNLIENSGVVMYSTSLSGHITFANSKAVELTGYGVKELIGKSFTKIADKAWLGLLFEKYSEQLKNNTGDTTLEFCIRTKEGELKWVEQTTVLIIENSVATGFQCVIKDISQRKEMEAELRNYELKAVEYQERLQSILDNATSLIYIKDLEGRYLLINKEFKKALGVNDSMVIGKTDFEFTDLRLAQYFKNTDDQVITTRQSLEVEGEVEMNGGKRNLLIVKFPLIDAQNNLYGISGIATDITERVKFQEQLIYARTEAEDAKNLQEHFLANMSHEIRTPMNGIQGMTDLLLETSLDEEQLEFTKTIKQSTDNLLVIINDILDFSKIKAGKLIIEQINFSLADILTSIKKIFKHKLTEKGLPFNITIAENIPDIICGDPYRLNQVLVNLVGNAIKFTNTGEISVKITAGKPDSEGVRLHFSVKDTGIGIQQETLTDIFQSFTQASSDITRKYGGTGLGLAICRQLLKLQGGDIDVTSSPGEGSSFNFHTYYRYQNVLLAGAGMNKNIVKKEILLNKRFLIAEDNLVNQKVIMKVIANGGGYADVTNNGMEAISKLKEGARYDIIIMDLQMPEMDGYKTTKYIRTEMGLNTPIIAMTATAMKGEEMKCRQMGMNEYLSKPFVFENFYQSVQNVLAPTFPLLENADQGIADKKNLQLFNLSFLEEMEDDEYTMDILQTFLRETPPELDKLYNATLKNNFKEVVAIAHKLKSNTGLLKITGMSRLLELIEQTVLKENGNLLEMVTEVTSRYREVECSLLEHLKLMRTKDFINTAKN